jgi:hypothetical protein
MKQQTLQEQYNLIVEGKGNPSAFHKQALKQFPNLFTAQSSFDQVVNVLKQKSIISEMVAQGLVSNSSELNFFEIFNTNMAILAEEAKAEEKKPTKAVTDLETKGYDYKDKKNIDNQSGAEFLLGFYVESRNAKNVDKTVEEIRDIVTKNLAKDQLYYVKSGQFGVEGVGYTEDAPGLGKTKEVKGKYASSGMEPVKLSENISSNGAPKDKIISQLLGPDFYLSKKNEREWDEKDHELFDRIFKMASETGKVPKMNETYGNEIDVPNPSMLLQMDKESLGKVIDKMDNNDMQAFNRKFNQAEVSIKNALKDKLESFGLDKAFNLGESKDALVKEILKRLTGK